MNIIERKLILKSPLERAWNAVGTSEGFTAWFKSAVVGDWKVGAAVLLKWPSGFFVEIRIVEIDEPHHFAYQWHPGGSSMLADHPESELTTVNFHLRAVDGGTELHLPETGFDSISDEHKLKVLGLNTEGWDEELGQIQAYVEA